MPGVGRVSRIGARSRTCSNQCRGPRVADFNYARGWEPARRSGRLRVKTTRQDDRLRIRETDRRVTDVANSDSAECLKERVVDFSYAVVLRTLAGPAPSTPIADLRFGLRPILKQRVATLREHRTTRQNLGCRVPQGLHAGQRSRRGAAVDLWAWQPVEERILWQHSIFNRRRLMRHVPTGRHIVVFRFCPCQCCRQIAYMRRRNAIASESRSSYAVRRHGPGPSLVAGPTCAGVAGRVSLRSIGFSFDPFPAIIRFDPREGNDLGERMGDNWLSTLGSWFAYVIKALTGPWWDRLVEKKAEDAAVRLKLLEAVVRFRVSDFARLRSIDSDKSVGIAKRVVDRLKPLLQNSPQLDVTSDEFLKQVENEIQFCGVPTSAWIELACLAESKLFDPQMHIAVEYVEDRGGSSHGSTAIFTFGDVFPFWRRVLVLDGPQSAKLSPEATAGLTEFVGRVELPEAKYEFRGGMLHPAAQLESPLTLRKGWKPFSSPANR